MRAHALAAFSTNRIRRKNKNNTFSGRFRQVPSDLTLSLEGFTEVLFGEFGQEIPPAATANTLARQAERAAREGFPAGQQRHLDIVGQRPRGAELLQIVNLQEGRGERPLETFGAAFAQASEVNGQTRRCFQRLLLGCAARGVPRGSRAGDAPRTAAQSGRWRRHSAPPRGRWRR